MKLTVVLIAMFGLLMGSDSFARKPIAKKSTVSKRVARPAARPAPRRTVRKVVRRASAPSRKAVRAPARARVPAKPVRRQDVRGLANSIRSMQATPRAPEIGGRMMRGPSSAHEIGEAMRVTGQSRNLSMGLLFSKDSDKIEFGNPRMHYKDKITSRQANY